MFQNEWWRGATIYHVYLPSFSDSNGDGIGDLKGLAQHLDHIASLGVDAIWISPFYVSPMEDWGYDVADYREVDPRFGTGADVDALVEQIHRAGMRVIIDQVWSHTAAAHPWFEESQRSRDNPKHDWYIWANPNPEGGPPNNWLSVFGGSAWQWSPARRQYYLHHFLTSQPKLNLRNEAVLAQHFANAAFWLDRGVDGFRLDAVDFMLHDEELRDNPSQSAPGSEMPWNPFRLQRHVYDMCHADGVRLMQQIRDFMDRYPHATTIGEISSEVGALARIANLTGTTKLHTAYTLGAMKTAFSATTLRQILRETISLHRTGWLCWAFSNHDVQRVATRWNPRGANAAAFSRLEKALLLTLPGSVSLYQGEELGLPEAEIPFAAIRDPFGQHFYPVYSGRDGARTPMPWIADAPNAGFSTARETWLPVDPRHAALAVDRQEKDPESSLAAARRLIAWRKRHPALIRGEVDIIELPDPILAFRRHLSGEAMVAVFNLSDQPVSIDATCLPSFCPTAELPFVTPIEGTALRLPPFGFSLGPARP
jgi:alpha-glucosidase